MCVLEVAVRLTSWFLILFLHEYFASNNRLVRMPPVAKRDRVRENQGLVNRDLEIFVPVLVVGSLVSVEDLFLALSFLPVWLHP